MKYSKQSDEYHWSVYTKEYKAQLEEISDKDNMDFFVHDKANWELMNLHPNWKELYQCILSLRVGTAFECGCGGGYHMHNIKTISPNTHVYGCDLLDTQLDLALEWAGVANAFQMDMTKDITHNGRYEFVYSHAVIMHLSTENAIRFMKNMDKLSKKYIFMIEGEANHENWYELVKETLPEYRFSQPNKFINNSILLEK